MTDEDTYHARLVPPEEAMAMSEQESRRRPVLVLMATAVAVVLLVGVPLLLFRGDGASTASDDVSTTTAPPPATSSTTAPPTTADTTTTTPPDTQVPTTDAPAGMLPAPTSGDCREDWEGVGDRNVDVWYVFFTCSQPGMEETLVARPRGLRVGEDDLYQAMVAQLSGPTDEELRAGYFAFSIEDDGALSPQNAIEGFSEPPNPQFDFVDFSSNPGMSNASASSASMHLLAQLSSAVFQFSDPDTVTFTFSESCDAFWNWLQRDCETIDRSDWENGELTAHLAEWWQSGLVAAPTTTEPPGDTTTTLPGEPFDIGPAAGDVVAVVGVGHDDVLNLREGPGVGYEPLLGLDPLEDNVVSTGRHRLLEDSIWNEVTVDGVTGWVNSRFLGYLGRVDDLTALVLNNLRGQAEAETMLQLGEVVAESFRSDEGGFRYVVSVEPTVGDLGEVTYDVLGLADDAQLGFRLHIFGQPGGEGFSLRSVEATAICGRGVTNDGLCI